VVSTVSNPDKTELAARADADLVVNYTDADAADQVRAFAPRFDRIVEVALGPNLELDLAVAGPETVVVTYAADGPDPVLPISACMTANVTVRFLLYGVPGAALRQAAGDITDALEEGALTGLPVHHFPPDDVAAAHEAVERRAVGEVLIDRS
jgi:NADPH2:quinone reductase